MIRLMKVKVAAVIKLKMETNNKNVLEPSRGYTLEIIFELIVLRYGWLIKRQEDIFQEFSPTWFWTCYENIDHSRVEQSCEMISKTL